MSKPPTAVSPADQLMALMSDISERCWYAEWLQGTEFVLWSALQTGPIEHWGHGSVTLEDIDQLRRLSYAAGGWIAWAESNVSAIDPEIVPFDKWEQRLAQHALMGDDA